MEPILVLYINIKMTKSGKQSNDFDSLTSWVRKMAETTSSCPALVVEIVFSSIPKKVQRSISLRTMKKSHTPQC